MVDVGPTEPEPEPTAQVTDETGDDFEMVDDEDELMRQHLALVEAHAHLPVQRVMHSVNFYGRASGRRHFCENFYGRGVAVAVFGWNFYGRCKKLYL